jgi:phosphatidate cytidylyltransferase
MLKTRVLTALIIGPTALLVIFVAPPWGFRLAVALLLLIGSWEFRRLAGLGRAWGGVLIAIQLLTILLLMKNWSALDELSLTLLAAACLTWCLMFLRLVTFRDGQAPDISYHILGFGSAYAGITFAWFALAWLRDLAQGQFWILLLIIIIWAADIGAYFSGRAFGKRKLAPAISPGKTWEGLLGGLLLALLAAFALVRLGPWLNAGSTAVIILTAVTVLASAGGDLFISIHKRTMGLKDTGTLFPGHGGVLDRFDSLLAGAPFFALGLRFITGSGT